MSAPDCLPFTTLLIIPTGVAAQIGGFAGDAIPVARTLASLSDRLITHPNVMNGAQLYWPIPNALYVEGYGLDQFAAGRWQLVPVRRNRIGLVLDRGMRSDLKVRQLQAADAAQATLGLSITGVAQTDRPLNVRLHRAQSGAAWGTLEHPDSLLRAADHLLRTQSVDAIAVIVQFPETLDDQALADYRQGKGVDPLAGAEAVISHLVVREFQRPCAHAPALSPLPLDRTLSPRSAAEELGYTFLPSVLVGLSRAPQFILASEHHRAAISGDQVSAVIVPASCCGGSAVLSLAQQGTPIIAVTENSTAMDAFPEALGIQALVAQSYLEAVGIVAALKSGVEPGCLTCYTNPSLAATLEEGMASSESPSMAL
ncbi:DUF3326 domain-containing protein [Lyngbya confervoides]|uniref:DUF3326 domain-containing protein n=1 Tax=Lyngbya confervoides BDU141951 TaxID=1574623 RepID=A0ABD4T231_9CYAN|nr:DUF3326 domain-containing protein [Lyngbya confervoides]MCM1982743.1 DUF3326 domain-containing protein [Lyngbya confervoides BDU141951]